MKFKKEVELVLEPVGDRLGLAARHRHRVVGREAVALRLAAVAGVERPEPTDDPAVDRALRDLVGRVPRAAVGHRRGAEFAFAQRLGVAQHRVVLSKVVGNLPRPVVV